MANEGILIDISTIQNVKKDNTNEIIHTYAYNKLQKILASSLLDSSSNHITDCRWHNTIFISGERGSGKTTFLVNIDNFLKDYDEKNKTDKGAHYFILKPIDPTIIETGDDFLLVIVGQIKKQVEEHQHKNGATNDEDKKRKYYQALQDVAEAIESKQAINKSVNIGVDSILDYQNGLDLEDKLHKFYKSVCDLVKKNIIILLIDDVDMAFQNGFDILEILRKFTASPYLLPIVTGYAKLYETIISQTIANNLNYTRFTRINYKDTENKKELETFNTKYHDIFTDQREPLYNDNEKYYADVVNDMTDKYLAKIFPFDRQIHIESKMSKICKDNPKIKFYWKGQDKNFTYNKLETIEAYYHNMWFGNSNRENYRKTLPENPRLFFQYLSKKLEQYKEWDVNSKEVDIEKYKEVLDKTRDFTHNQREFKDVYLETETNYNAIENDAFSVGKVLNGVFFDPNQNEFLKINPENVTSNIKVCIRNTMVGKTEHEGMVKTIKANKPSDDGVPYNMYFFWHLFTHSNYYSSYQQTNFVFVGKFVEFVFSSLSLDFDEEKAKSILLKGPFMSNISKTKPLEGEDEDSEGESINGEDGLSTIVDNLFEKDSKTLLNNITKNAIEAKPQTDKKNDDTIIQTPEQIKQAAEKIAQAAEEKVKQENEKKAKLVIPARFLHAVLNKFYNNVIMFKDKYKGNDSFDVYIARIALMLLNAVAYFESTDEVGTKDNIAMFDGSGVTVADVFMKVSGSSNSYRVVQKMRDKENSLTKLIYNHPIIKAIYGMGDETSELRDNLSKIIVSSSPRGTVKDSIKKQLPEGFEEYIEEILNAENVDELRTILNDYDNSFRKSILETIKKRNDSELQNLKHILKSFDDKDLDSIIKANKGLTVVLNKIASGK